MPSSLHKRDAARKTEVQSLIKVINQQNKGKEKRMKKGSEYTPAPSQIKILEPSFQKRGGGNPKGSKVRSIRNTHVQNREHPGSYECPQREKSLGIKGNSLC